MINRSVIIIKYKQKFVDWLNREGPHDQHITLNMLNKDCLSYLVDSDIIQNQFHARKWVLKNRAILASSEFLTRGHQDPPKYYSNKKFEDWFTWECHTTILDKGNDPIEFRSLLP